MLVRIDVQKEDIVEQGEDYIVIDVDLTFKRHAYACKIRTSKRKEPKAFNEGDVKSAKAIYVGVNGGLS